MKINSFITRPSLILAACLATASIQASPASAASGTIYPLLPDLPGADIYGEARLVIYLDQNEPLVEVDGQLYALGGRPLEVAFDGLDHVTLLFVVPRNAGVFVTEDGVWTQNLDPSSTSRMLAFDLPDMFGSTPPSSETEEFGFEVALPGQPGPTVPDVVIRPTEDDPDPT